MRGHATTFRPTVLATAALLAMSGSAFGQACLGTPTANGQFAINGDIGFTDGARTYGGTLAADLVGPLAVRAGYSRVDYDDIDPSGNRFNAMAAAEVPNIALDVCPTIGLQYTRISEEASAFGAPISSQVSILEIPIGVAIGYQLTLERGVTLLPYANPHVLWRRDRVQVSDGTDTLSGSGSVTEFGTSLGLSVGMRSLYINGALLLTTLENTDPTFSIGAGVLLPGVR